MVEGFDKHGYLESEIPVCVKGDRSGHFAKLRREAPKFWMFFDFMLCKVLNSFGSILSLCSSSKSK